MTRPDAAEEGGFTLIELLVAIFIMAVVLAVMYRGLASMQSTAAATQERLANLDEARIAMATVTKDIRTAAHLTPVSSPFCLAEPQRATFYANLNGTTGPNVVDIYVDAQRRLIERIVAPSPTTPDPPDCSFTATPRLRAVAENVANTSTPMFVYLDAAGNTLPAPVSAADRVDISAVEVVIQAGRTGGLGPPLTTLRNRVRLPNVDYNSQTQG